MFRVCHALLPFYCSLVVTCWERADIIGSLVCDVLLCFCHFPMWCPGLGVVLYLSIPDLCLISNFNYYTYFLKNISFAL